MARLRAAEPGGDEKVTEIRRHALKSFEEETQATQKPNFRRTEEIELCHDILGGLEPLNAVKHSRKHQYKDASASNVQRALKIASHSSAQLQAPVWNDKFGVESTKPALSARTSVRYHQIPRAHSSKLASAKLKAALAFEVNNGASESAISPGMKAQNIQHIGEQSAGEDKLDETVPKLNREISIPPVSTLDHKPQTIEKRNTRKPTEAAIELVPGSRIFKLPPTFVTSPSSRKARPSSSEADNAAVLTYSPPRRRSPAKVVPTSARPRTPSPPASPFKSRLTSPSKPTCLRIPPTPHRPSIDDFWSQSAINEWNDQYSPKKVLTSPSKPKRTSPCSDDDDFPSLSSSPRKNLSKASPQKRDPQANQAKRSFEARKHALAEQLLGELDTRVTGGRISELAAATGGVKLIWSKKLNSTAGRANWKREYTSQRNPLSGEVTKITKHYASIELAEKVIDEEDRLVNVLAHEFCHLANFMISGVKDNPHGKEFKEWAKKVMDACTDRHIVVTTKHSYEIAYKYIWECQGCGREYQRHSKSIDPAKHCCSSCKGKLRQTKPPPRSGADKPTEYQSFVKEHFQKVRRENPGLTHGAVMETLGKMYRERDRTKTDAGKEAGSEELNSLTKALEVIVLTD